MRRQSTFQEDPGEIVLRVREWVETVTGRELGGDLRESLQNGIVLCEFMAKIRPGSIQRVNKLSSPIAHLDNIRSFLQACRVHFQLKDAQTFDVTDLQDPEQRCGTFTSMGSKGWGAEKRLKSVCVTLYWIGRKLAEEQEYQGPLPDLSVFHPVLPGQVKSVPIPEEPDEVLVSPPPERPRQPPSVPSKPDHRVIAKFSKEEARGISTESVGELREERIEITIVPINGSFGFHLLSRQVEGTNKFLSTVHSVLEDSSAGRAGLQKGDELLKVNGMDTSYFSHQQIVKLIKDSVIAQSLTVLLRRRTRVPAPTIDTVPEKREEIKSLTPPQEVQAPPDTSIETHNGVTEEQSHKEETTTANPAHYVFDTEEAPKPKYRDVPPPPDEAIYVNQTVVGREGPAGKEGSDPPKPTKASSKDRSPRNRKRSQERAQPEGSSDLKETTLGAKTPRAQMPLPPTPQKETSPAPNSEPTRRRFFGSKKSGDQSPPKRSSWKSGWKEAIVQSVDISSPPARLESVRLEPSEDSGEDLLEGRQEALKQERAMNRVSMSDPFKGILPVSDGRSLLDEIFPDGDEIRLSSIIQDESPLKTPPQTHKPSTEYFANILNPQISQQEGQAAPPPVPQEVRLRTSRETERDRHSPTRSSASSERHSAKLVGSLLGTSGPQVTPVSNDRRKERRDRQETQKQQMPPPAPEVLKQEPPVSTAEPTVSTHSLPQSLKPPPGPLAVPSNSSVESSPSRHYANTQVNKPTVQQVPPGYQGKFIQKGYISRAKSFTGNHPSRDSSDERNFSQLMARGYPGSDYTQESVWSQRGQNLMRGQSLRHDILLSPGRSLLQQYPRQVPYPQGTRPIQHPQAQAGYALFQQQQGGYGSGQPALPRPVRHTEPQVPQVPQDGQYISKIFQIYHNNASIPCTSCKIPLGVGAATGVHGLQNIYHPPCFLCEVCGSQLFESTFVLRGKLHCRCCKDSKEGSLSTEC